MLNALDFGLVLAVAGLFAWGVWRKARRIAVGTPEDRCGDLRRRAARCVQAVVGHTRILRERPEGLHHAYLFAAFALMLALVVAVQIAFRLPGALAGPASLAVEILGVLGLYGTWRLYRRRYAEKPDRLDDKPEDRWGLVLILAVFVTGFAVTALRIGATGGAWNLWHPVAFVLSLPFQALPDTAVATLVGWVWRLHLLLVLLAVATAPWGKLSHLVFGTANIFFQNLGPKGAFRPVDIENSEYYGIGQVEHFSWKHLLDLEACVRCGRCQAKCPAYNTEKTLNPKKVVQDLKSHWLAKVPYLERGEGDSFEDPMIDGAGVQQVDIWSCTTCRHCMEACPMHIEHVDKIVEMRRHLVLMEGQMPQELVTLNKNLENNFNPWGVGWSARNDWMGRRGVDLRVLPEEDNPEFEVLLWVGCAGAYDDRYQRVMASTARLLERAGVSFGILGTQEKCCGDPARASGNEYLYQSLVAENIAAMDALGVRKIVATCPHCLKTLSKEYPQFGGTYEVIHHSRFLLDLVAQGRIKLVRDLPAKLTLHDSCYLSRYAGMVEEPRALLGAVPGLELVEMERCREENFCCGAGGGRMWMEEESPRINNVRAAEALETGAELIGSACPFCLTMLDDGVKAHKREEDVKVLDLAEILERATA
ncbi:MAG: heterodisulfide reductase-related iron-sulfur binding cluster [Deferrisomatales bacterium]